MTTEPTIYIAPGIALPPIMIQRFRNVHGRSATDEWLGRLASTLPAWLATWEIELDQVEPPDTFNIVLFGHSAKAGEVVLKLSPPTFESRAELAAVKQTSGPGFVRLIDADPSISLMMLERIRPGTELGAAELSEEAATRICAAQLLKYWREPADVTDLIPLDRWAKELLTHDPAAHPHRRTCWRPARRSLTSCSRRRQANRSSTATCTTRTSSRVRKARTAPGLRSIPRA